MKRLAPIAALLLCAAFALLCLAKARLIGDGIEYLTMAQGFAAHGSPDLRRSDVDALAALPPKALARSLVQPNKLHEAIERIERDGHIVDGYALAKDGSIHPVHFWMYSLLATPFYVLVTLLGQNPFMALAALNLAILGLAMWRFKAWFPQAGLPELGLLLLMGPVYYLVWTGPEVLAGCCVLMATLAALRRDLPLAVALAGLGATQNPSIAGLIPAAACYALLYRWAPSSALSAAPPGARGRLRGVLLVAIGIALAALPYLHNQAMFGMPSIISHYYTDLGLVTPERLFSFLFDLNQGVLAGFPALLACIALVLIAGGRVWLLHLGIALLLALGMALPTLAATNWNSGAIVVARYAYWTAMPIVAICLARMTQLEARRRWLLLAAGVLLQGAASWQFLRIGGQAANRHGLLANQVLDHAPGRYNPDPEIFLERERRREDPITHEQVVVHQGPNGPTKLMRFWSNSLDSAGLCAAGSHLVAGDVVTLRSGWRYYNAPLRCAPGPAPAMLFKPGTPSAPVLGAGWSVLQGEAVWNEGRSATLRLALPAGRRLRSLGLLGFYQYPVYATRLHINGVDFGVVRLGRAPLTLGGELATARELELRLEHSREPVPASERDPRRLGFHLQGVAVEFAP